MQRLNLARASKLKDVALMSTDMPESDGDILKAVSLAGMGLSDGVVKVKIEIAEEVLLREYFRAVRCDCFRGKGADFPDSFTH